MLSLCLGVSLIFSVLRHLLDDTSRHSLSFSAIYQKNSYETMKHQHGLLVTPCNPVSFTGFCPIRLNLRTLATVHSRQHASHRHSHICGSNRVCRYFVFRILTPIGPRYIWIINLIIAFSPLHSCADGTQSYVVVLRILTNKYFLLFSPLNIYRWKNPKYKFLLLLDRQWPMYAKCIRCLFL